MEIIINIKHKLFKFNCTQIYIDSRQNSRLLTLTFATLEELNAVRLELDKYDYNYEISLFVSSHTNLLISCKYIKEFWIK